MTANAYRSSTVQHSSHIFCGTCNKNSKNSSWIIILRYDQSTASLQVSLFSSVPRVLNSYIHTQYVFKESYGEKEKGAYIHKRHIHAWLTMLITKTTINLTNPRNIFGYHVPYILESNPHPFYSFRGLKNQMRIRIACGLDSRSRAGFWKNDRAAVRAVRTIQ